MNIKFNLAVLLGLLLTFTKLAAVEPLPNNLVNFSSQQGSALLHKNLNHNTLSLLAHFTTQETLTYCGVASAVMILNSMNIHSPVDTLHAPYHYFTQDNFFNDTVKNIITPSTVQKNGLTLLQLSQLIQSYGLNATPYFANKMHLSMFRKILRHAIIQQHFVIVNFLRTGLGEQGGGHHSPVAAYDEKTDRFLILDVARYKYPAYWVKAKDLWNGVNTLDGDSYRGMIVISK